MTRAEAEKYLNKNLDLDGKYITTTVQTSVRKIISLTIEEGSVGVFHVVCELETETGERYFHDLECVLNQYNVIQHV